MLCRADSFLLGTHLLREQRMQPQRWEPWLLSRYATAFYGFPVVMIELPMASAFRLFSPDDPSRDVLLVSAEHVGLVSKVSCLVFERKHYNEA